MSHYPQLNVQPPYPPQQTASDRYPGIPPGVGGSGGPPSAPTGYPQVSPAPPGHHGQYPPHQQYTAAQQSVSQPGQYPQYGQQQFSQQAPPSYVQQPPSQQYPSQHQAPQHYQHGGAAPAKSLLLLTRQEFVFPTQQTFLIKEKLLSIGDSYSVSDARGSKVFTLESKMLSFHERKVLVDRSGKSIAELSKKTISLHDSWEIQSPGDGKVLATVGKRFSLLNKKFEVRLATGETLKVSGNVLARAFQIEASSGAPLAWVAKAGFLQGGLVSDSYSLTVNAGVDSAFMVLLVVLLDQLYHEPGK